MFKILIFIENLQGKRCFTNGVGFVFKMMLIITLCRTVNSKLSLKQC